MYMSQNKWFQDGPPSSYKIQIMIVDIPQHLRLDKNYKKEIRFIDVSLKIKQLDLLQKKN